MGRPKGSKNAKPDLAWPKPKSTMAAKTARKPGKADASPMRSHAAAATAVLPLRKRLPDPKQGWPQAYRPPSQLQSAAAASEDHPAFGGPPPIEAVAPRKQNTGMLTKNSGQLAEAARRMGERKQSAGMEARAKRMADAKANAPAGGGPGAAADAEDGVEEEEEQEDELEEEGIGEASQRGGGGGGARSAAARAAADAGEQPFKIGQPSPQPQP